MHHHFTTLYLCYLLFFVVAFFQNLNLAGNRVRSLQGLEDHDLLESIDLEDNEVSNMCSLHHSHDIYIIYINYRLGHNDVTAEPVDLWNVKCVEQIKLQSKTKMYSG